LSTEIESAITHELNHAYEGWNRFNKGKGGFSTDVTWALDVNRAKIKKDIWKIWYDQIGYYFYYSEPFEVNAMIQDAWPFVKKYDNIKEMKEKTPSWTYANRMINFKASTFKQKMTEKILNSYPDGNVDVDILLNRLKNSFANELIKLRQDSISRKEDKPYLSGEDVKKMSVDSFLNLVEKKVNKAGGKIQRRILKMYSLKSKYNNENN
jgi:hypothetical protein